jgi:hypothetical protein
MRNRPGRRGSLAATLWASAHLTPGLAVTGFRSGARSGRCRIGRNATTGEARAVVPIDDGRRREDSSGHLARRQVRNAHAGPEAAAQTCRGAMIVMMLMLMRCRSRHVLVLMRTRLASYGGWCYGVGDRGARQKCQRAKQQQKLRCQLPHAPKASADRGRGQGPHTKQSAQAGQRKA